MTRIASFSADPPEALTRNDVIVLSLADRCPDLGLFFLHRLHGGHARHPSHVDHDPTGLDAGLSGGLAEQ